jgi:hypothetical protein
VRCGRVNPSWPRCNTLKWPHVVGGWGQGVVVWACPWQVLALSAVRPTTSVNQPTTLGDDIDGRGDECIAPRIGPARAASGGLARSVRRGSTGRAALGNPHPHRLDRRPRIQLGRRPITDTDQALMSAHHRDMPCSIVSTLARASPGRVARRWTRSGRVGRGAGRRTGSCIWMSRGSSTPRITWQDEARAFGNHDPSGVDSVYPWTDGVHLNVRLDEEKHRCW